MHAHIIVTLIKDMNVTEVMDFTVARSLFYTQSMVLANSILCSQWLHSFLRYVFYSDHISTLTSAHNKAEPEGSPSVITVWHSQIICLHRTQCFPAQCGSFCPLEFLEHVHFFLCMTLTCICGWHCSHRQWFLGTFLTHAGISMTELCLFLMHCIKKCSKTTGFVFW